MNVYIFLAVICKILLKNYNQSQHTLKENQAGNLHLKLK